jgi:hypothetical protein
MSITLTDGELRGLGRWAADCAERALPLFEATAPADPRPREALEAVRAFGAGGRRTAHLRSAALAALAAAREVDDPVAEAAGRAAGYAASSAYLHPLASPHQVRHIVGPAQYEAYARELATGDPDVGHAEIRWAIDHAPEAVRDLIRRFPAGKPGRSRLGELHRQLEAGLRG